MFLLSGYTYFSLQGWDCSGQDEVWPASNTDWHTNTNEAKLGHILTVHSSAGVDSFKFGRALYHTHFNTQDATLSSSITQCITYWRPDIISLTIVTITTILASNHRNTGPLPTFHLPTDRLALTRGAHFEGRLSLRSRFILLNNQRSVL